MISTLERSKIASRITTSGQWVEVIAATLLAGLTLLAGRTAWAQSGGNLSELENLNKLLSVNYDTLAAAQKSDPFAGSSYAIKFKKSFNIAFTGTLPRNIDLDGTAQPNACGQLMAVFQDGKQLKDPYNQRCERARVRAMSEAEENGAKFDAGTMTPSDCAEANSEVDLESDKPFCEVFYTAAVPASALTSGSCATMMSADQLGTTVASGATWVMSPVVAFGDAPRAGEARHFNVGNFMGEGGISRRVPGAVLATTCFSDSGASRAVTVADVSSVFGASMVERVSFIQKGSIMGAKRPFAPGGGAGPLVAPDTNAKPARVPGKGSPSQQGTAGAKTKQGKSAR